jgi:chromosome segregation ATPase
VCSCVSEEDPDSPVKTISTEQERTVRIINPIELLDKIEEAEAKLKNLDEVKGADVQRMTEKLTRESKSEEELQKEIDTFQHEITNLETSLNVIHMKKQDLIQQNKGLQHEIEALNAKFLRLTEIKTQKKAEIEDFRLLIKEQEEVG